MNINELAKTIHAQNVDAGWWPEDTCIYTKIQLISTEVAEATEGERKNLMDDHLPHRRMGEVELADVLIRTLDLGGYMGHRYDCTLEVPCQFDKHSTIGEMHYHINKALFQSYTRPIQTSMNDMAYTLFINCVLKCAEYLNYDIESAMMEKLEYNKQRADHKLANRAKEGGKKF